MTSVPSLYQPHDLQHLHFPQFFPKEQREERERVYRAFCSQAKIVAIMSQWGKADLIRHYSLPPEKISVIPWGPVISAESEPTEAELETTRNKLSLPSDFAFYPAQTWEHKNHLGLLEALAVARDRHGVSIPLVCSGHKNEFYPRIEERVRELNLAAQVRFVGFVTPLELNCLYRLSQFLVFPSMFEGWGLPLTEAFIMGTPVACSNISPLREQVADAALTFDPQNTDRIVEALLVLRDDERKRQEFVQRGHRRVRQFSWDRTARIFRAHYRTLANRALTKEDRALLAEPPLV